MASFGVDDVVPAAERLPVVPLGERFRDALALGGDPSTPVIAQGNVHALLGAVGIAFAQHRPLVLSPDAVWLTIAQGVAQHVRLNASQLRGQLVRHDGHKRLRVTVGAMPGDAAAWSAVVSGLREQLASEIGDGRARLFECNFSTTTEVDRVASQVILLDAYSPYFSYWLMAVCGIPTVTLTGTVDDWRQIRARIDIIAELGLQSWCRSLVPIADQLVRAAAGDPDIAFWRRIYNPIDAYGGEVITGWITRLYPYVKADGQMDQPNPMLALAIDEPRDITTKTDRSYNGPGLRSSNVPNTRSRVTIHVVDQTSGQLSSVAIEAGVVAVAQDADGALRPIAGWHLRPGSPEISEMLDRIAREHAVVPATVDAADHNRLRDEGPAEVMALVTRFASATLFEGGRTWQILPRERRDTVELYDPHGRERFTRWHFQRLIDLHDGRSVCYATSWSPTQPSTYWLVCRLEPCLGPDPLYIDIDMLPRRAAMVDPPDQIALLGTSLAALLDAALACDGEIDHLAAGRLDELLAKR